MLPERTNQCRITRRTSILLVDVFGELTNKMALIRRTGFWTHLRLPFINFRLRIEKTADAQTCRNPQILYLLRVMSQKSCPIRIEQHGISANQNAVGSAAGLATTRFGFATAFIPAVNRFVTSDFRNRVHVISMTLVP